MPDGSKRWRFRYRFAGQANMISLGLLVDVPLDTARKLAADARDLLSQGIDPSAHRQAEKAALNLTFESAARQWLSTREALLKKGAIVAPTFRKQHQILERYVFPVLGSRPLNLITAHALLITLKAIESKGLGDTAHRAKRACWRIFNFAEIRDLLTTTQRTLCAARWNLFGHATMPELPILAGSAFFSALFEITGGVVVCGTRCNCCRCYSFARAS
jgi:hypothetical protein